MGDSISEGVIEEFVKGKLAFFEKTIFIPYYHTVAGDFVEADEIIARIETDKVTVDITAPQSGVIQEYYAAEGDTVDVGADFYKLDTDAKGSSTPKAAAPETPKAATPEPAQAAT
jgi:2-oxoglutarate dehydrogenase E2 component (dihydrolipoamide succinyltransferase)